MQRLLFQTVVGAMVVAWSVAAMAKGAPKTPLFLKPTDYDVSRILPPPPAAESDRAKFELVELHQIEAARTPALEEQARSDSKTKDATIFAAAVGEGFDLAALPKTAKLLADVRNDEKVAADAAKDFFKRDRPWIVDPSLKSCSREDEAQTSYPSGHATMGYAIGVVLASLAPAKAQSILARSAAYAESRLECEVHVRSDIVAGQVLGTIVAERLMRNPAFKVEYAAAAKELAAAHLIAQ